MTSREKDGKMLRAIATFTVTAAVATIPSASGQAQTTASEHTIAGTDIVVVRMLDKSPTSYAFEPSLITVTRGQTIRFVQQGAVPHNVEFKGTPAGARLGDGRMGPFLTSKGEAYELRVDDRFSAGTYDYVCTPHAAMGMKGTIVVDGSEARAIGGEGPVATERSGPDATDAEGNPPQEGRP